MRGWGSITHVSAVWRSAPDWWLLSTVSQFTPALTLLLAPASDQWCGVVWSASVTLQKIFYCVTRISSHCLPSLVKLRTPSKWFPFITCNLSISQSHFNTNQMVGTRQTLVQCRDLDIKILTFYLCFHSLEQMAAKFEICTWNITVIFQLNRKYVYTVCLGSKPSNQPTRLWEKINYFVVNNLPIRNK